MKIDILCVGKIKENYIKKAIEEYAKRMTPYANIRIIEVNEEKISLQASPKEVEEVIAKEGERLMKHMAEKAYPIALCIEGKMLSSEDLANQLEEIALSGKSHIQWIIGGSYGLSPKIKERAFPLSFSKMTFPHQLMRLILMEQIYRAFRILRKEPYHK